MSNEKYRVIHKHSMVTIDGLPKLPTSGSVEYGEIAINYAKSAETLSIRNSENEIVTFSSDDKFNESFRVMSKAMCDLDDKVTILEEMSAITVGDVIYTESDLNNVSASGKVVDALVVKGLNEKIIELSGATPSLETTIAVSGDSAITVTVGEETSNALVVPYATSAETIVGTIMTVGEFSGLTETGKYVDAKVLKDVIKDNEEITSAAINDLNDRIIELSGATPTIDLISTEEEFSGLTVSGKVADALVLKNVIEDNEEVVANALIDINDKINELSGATPDLDIIYDEEDFLNVSTSGSLVDALVVSNVIKDNEEVTSTALNYLDNRVDGLELSATSANTRITTLESSATSVNTRLNNLETSATSLNTRIGTLESSATSINTRVTNLEPLARRTRLTSFSLDVLKQAVADQNLEKYGLKVGDETTINGYTYVIAGLNPMAGPYTPYRVNVNHVGLIVIPHTTQAWNVAGNTYTGADGRGAGYKNCDLHYYLKNTTLPHVQNDLGSNNLISHNKLLSSDVNTTGYNRYGTNTGCASSWAWEADCYISALSEIQVYGSIVWSSAGYDTGEACRQLDVFRVYNMNEIFGWEYPWLRDVSSASYAAHVHYLGDANYYTASNARYVAALILFH